MVIVVQNRIPVTKGWEREFEARWKNRKWLLARLPGFIRNEVLRPVRGDYYIVKTYWRSRRDFARWTKSKEFAAAHANTPPKEAFAGPNVFEMHEVLVTYERPKRATPSRRVRPRR